jgi:hypothetical protein
VRPILPGLAISPRSSTLGLFYNTRIILEDHARSIRINVEIEQKGGGHSVHESIETYSRQANDAMILY